MLATYKIKEVNDNICRLYYNYFIFI